MTVDRAYVAATATNDGHTYYFCSIECRDQFVAGPRSVLTHADHGSGGHRKHHQHH